MDHSLVVPADFAAPSLLSVAYECRHTRHHLSIIIMVGKVGDSSGTSVVIENYDAYISSRCFVRANRGRGSLGSPFPVSVAADTALAASTQTLARKAGTHMVEKWKISARVSRPFL